MTQTQQTRASPMTVGGLNITQEDVVRAVVHDIRIRGLDKAIERFDTLESMFRGQEGWAETSLQVEQIFEREQARRDARIVDNRTVNLIGNNTTYNENLKRAYQ